jgi:hypothetical protein
LAVVFLRATVVSMVPAAPLLPAMLPARPAVAHADVPEAVVGGAVEGVGELEDVLADDPLVDVGDEVVVGADDVDEQAPNTVPHSKPPTNNVLRHMLIPSSSLSSDGGGG